MKFYFLQGKIKIKQNNKVLKYLNKDIQRLDKFISSQTNISRKDAHKLIFKGKVLVNGNIVKKIDIKVDPNKDDIKLENEKISYKKQIYIMMNKPQGVVSASKGKNEKTVVDLVPDDLYRKGLFPAGRLDKDTTGFVLITDDGDFAHKLLAPKNAIPKTYEALVDIKITEENIQMFERGLVLDDGTKLQPATLSIIGEKNEGQIVQIVITEGKYHQIKRMIGHIGGKVLMLKRTKIGLVLLDKNLQLGQSREILPKELESFLL